MIKIGSAIINKAHIVSIQPVENSIIVVTTTGTRIDVEFNTIDDLIMEYSIISQILGVS